MRDGLQKLVAGIAAGVPVLGLLAACSTTEGSGGSSSSVQPRTAVYRCNGGETLNVLNKGGSVVIERNGDTVELPASPPGSRTRYTLEQIALVIDGREAIYFRTGSAPLTCKR